MKEEYAKYLLEKTKKDYDLIAEEFSLTRTKLWEELSFLFYEIEAGEKILDLGCGNGRWFEILQKKNVRYYGIDFSEKLIAIAQKSFPQANFQVGDVFNLPFAENFFDKIYAIALFHHLPSNKVRLEFLKEAKRVLKPKGKLILTVWKFHRLKDFLSLLKYTIFKLIGKSNLDFRDFFQPWGKKTKRYYHWFTQGELKKIVEKAGFEILALDVVKNKKGSRKNIFLIAQKL